MADITKLNAKEVIFHRGKTNPQNNPSSHQGTQVKLSRDNLAEKKRNSSLALDSKLQEALQIPSSSGGRGNPKIQKMDSDSSAPTNAIDAAALQTWFSDAHDAATPLVLVKKDTSSINQAYEKADEKAAERPDIDTIYKCLHGYNIFLFHPHHVSPPVKLSFPGSATEIEIEPLLEGLCCAGRMDEDPFDVAVAKTISAAVLKGSVLGYKNLELAALMTEKLDAEMRSLALNEALFSCRGELGASVAKQLLLDGADPNSTKQIDDFQCLANALVNLDKPMIEVLLSAGADPDLENDTYGTTRSFLADDKYLLVRDLFAMKK